MSEAKEVFQFLDLLSLVFEEIDLFCQVARPDVRHNLHISEV